MAPVYKAKFQKLKALLVGRYPNLVPADIDIRSQMYNYHIKKQPKICECGGNIVFFTRLRDNHPLLLSHTPDQIKELSYNELNRILDTS